MFDYSEPVWVNASCPACGKFDQFEIPANHFGWTFVCSGYCGSAITINRESVEPCGGYTLNPDLDGPIYIKCRKGATQFVPLHGMLCGFCAYVATDPKEKEREDAV
ncbi:hypothetical protein, partial [Nonomuraea longicatena]|uniref:hypothetical protein n=1 Tax=Nonomuraea longicatena TaxID=83682 RepID=UPI0031DF7079